MSELDHRLVLDGFSDAVVASDESGGIRYVNHAVERLLGWTRDELIGQPLTVLMPERYHAAHREGFTRFVTTGESRIIGKPVQLSARHRDGTEIDIELTLSAYPGEGQVLIVAAMRDLREAARFLDRSRRAALIADALPQLVWMAGGDGVVETYNRRFYEYSGRDPATPASAESWEGLMHPVDRAAGRAAWDHSLTTGALHDVEIRLRRAADGVYRWHLLRSVPVRDPRGRITTWVGSATDIDDQKRGAERASFLADASALLAGSLDPDETLRRLARLAVPRIADWCSIHMVDGAAPRPLIVAHVDPAKVAWAEELSREYPPDPAAPRGVHHVIRTGQAEVYPDIPEEVLVAAARDERHLELIRQLGMRSGMTVPLRARGTILGAITLVTAESGRRYDDADVRLARELAERAALAVDNARLYADAQEAVRVRDEFLSIASHELRTPLTPLQLHVQDMLRRAEGEGPELPADKLAAKLDTVARQVDRLQVLVDNLLDISRITQHRLKVDYEEIDLAEIVREAVGRFGRTAEHAGVALTLDVPEPVLGYWDRQRLEQIVSNLLSNAIKFGAGEPVEVRLRAQDGVATLTVRDHGIGIAAEDQARIFERFERAVTSKHYGGFGLGLWIVRQVIEALGGTIEVDSEIGAGSRFTVALPQAIEDRVSVAPPVR